MHPDHERALKCALHYRKLGLSPLPSCDDKKAPCLPSFKAYQSQPIPDSVYDSWKARNIQVMTGYATASPLKILVVDCDGELSHETWEKMCEHHDFDASSGWISRTGSGGWHYWFSLPEGTSCQTRVIWSLWDTWGQTGSGGWVPHTEINILGDGSLAIAPPSVHVSHPHMRYEFSLASPRQGLPAEAPKWLLEAPRIPYKMEAPGSRPSRPQAVGMGDIQGKMEIASSWGVRFVGGTPADDGWVVCRAIGREDRNPSCSFNVDSGAFFDHKTRESLSFFDLGASLGRFPTWRECRGWCQEQFGR